jgi:rhodanese-related sulfurtransferase
LFNTNLFHTVSRDRLELAIRVQFTREFHRSGELLDHFKGDPKDERTQFHGLACSIQRVDRILCSDDTTTGFYGEGAVMRGETQSVNAAALPKEKQTVLGLYVTAKQAYERWQSDPENVFIIDVRTPEEFLFVGNPPMAWKIPVAAQIYEWDAEKGKFPMKLLPDFASRVSGIAKADDAILLMCRSGGRSAIAANLLAQAGFKNVYNIVDGMEGDTVSDPDSLYQGQRLKNGWKNSGVPWTYDLSPERMLLPKA